MQLNIKFPFRAFLCAIPFCIILSIHCDISQHNSQNLGHFVWENLTAGVTFIYHHRSYDNQESDCIPSKGYVFDLKLEELLDNVFIKGYLCNDEDKAMCMQKIEKLDDNSEQRLTVVAYFFPIKKINYIYKIEFVDEKRTFIGKDSAVDHNLVSQKDWFKYKDIEKFLIKQKIIRDGDTSINTGQRIPLDGQPDFIFEDTYIKTKDHTLIHVESKKEIIDLNAAKILKSYIEEMLEYVRNGFD